MTRNMALRKFLETHILPSRAYRGRQGRSVLRSTIEFLVFLRTAFLVLNLFIIIFRCHANEGSRALHCRSYAPRTFSLPLDPDSTQGARSAPISVILEAHEIAS